MDRLLLVVPLVILAVLVLWLWFLRGQDRRELAKRQSAHVLLRTSQIGMQAAHAQAMQDRDVALGNLDAEATAIRHAGNPFDKVNARQTQLPAQHPRRRPAWPNGRPRTINSPPSTSNCKPGSRPNIKPRPLASACSIRSTSITPASRQTCRRAPGVGRTRSQARSEAPRSERADR